MPEIRLILLSLFFLNSFLLKAQLNANFTADKTSGCAPAALSVQFTDLSTGNPTSWNWNFGNGNSSTFQNPSTTYSSPGTYDVTLIIGNGTSFDTVVKTGFIKVFANPTANFTAVDSSGCIPFNAIFQDLSVKGDTTIVSWSWTFGDGASSNLPNPSHVYNSVNNFQVVLQVTDANGCIDTKVKPAYIKTTPKPVANFSATTPTISCVPPLNVNFSSSSTGSGSLSFHWYFGDGADTTISGTSISHNYTSSGSFDVSLVVTDPNGCKDSINKISFVRIADVIAAFTMSADTICPNIADTMFNSSVGASTYQWTFTNGNPASSTAQNPTVSYPSAGNYIIQLIAFGPQQLCSDTVTDTVNVELVSAGFIADTIYGCESPLKVDFTDTSINAVSWSWNFGDGTPNSNIQNPSHIYNYTGTGTINYNVSLTVVSLHGCSSTVSKPVTINIITPNFAGDTLRGCAPLTVNFSNTTIPADSIAQFKWDFGDGVVTNSGLANSTVSGALNTTGLYKSPTHTYTNTGEFTVTLITTTVSGCIDTVIKPLYVEVGSQQPPIFSVYKDTICADTMFTFTDETFDPALVDEWKWSIGSYDVDGNPNPPYPGNQFGSSPTATYTPNDTGFYYVQLITGYNGCYDTLLKDYYVYVKGPYINITSSFDCAAPFTYFFDTTVFKDVKTFSWDFGDGSPFEETDIVTSHTYAYNYTSDNDPANNYWVKLLTYNDDNNCKFFDSVQIFVREIIADFSIDTTWGCLPLDVKFDGSSSQDENGIYIWNFGDSILYPGPSYDTVSGQPVSTHVFSKRGTMFIQMVVFDVNNCSDTAIQEIKIYKPIADFAADTLYGCVPFDVNFYDSSFFKSDTNVVKWEWSFGENNVTDTLNQNTFYSYETIGQKTVRLIVTDTIGCKDTIVKTNYITPLQPSPNWTISDDTVCFGTAANFTNTTTYLNGNTANLTYLWTFTSADSTQTSTQKNPSVVFSDTGNYTVNLVVKDTVLSMALGTCDSSVTVTNNLHVQPMPIANFFTDQDSVPCYPFKITFYDSSISDYSYSFFWTFGDGATSTIADSVSNFYTYPDTFDVSLTITTYNGCTDTKTFLDKIIVVGPQASFTLDPDTICIGDSVKLWLTYTNNVTAFYWDFGDGSLPEYNTDTTFHIYNQVGTLNPQLIYSSSPLCEKVDTNNKIFIHMVQADFIADTHICRSVNSVFTDASLNANSWLWNFGDGDSSTVKNPPPHIYNTEGQYSVSLSISNTATGCKDIAKKTITVYFSCDSAECNLTPPLVSTISDTTIIVGEEVTLYTTTQFTSTISWNPPDSLSCSNCLTPVANPNKTTTYIVSVKDENDCFTGYDTVTVNVRNLFSVDVPSAFTPNGDNVNDTVFVKGWGIKKLQLFQIYNRWGQLLFETSDIKQGWDGTYKGEPQNPETYVYIVNAENHEGQILFKKGYITLIR